MLLDDQSCSLISDSAMLKHKRRIPLYFLSSKALRRSRMTRGKRAVPKTGLSTVGNLKKTLSFGKGGSGMEGHVQGQDLEPSQTIVNQMSTKRIISTQEDLPNVSFFSYHFFLFNVFDIQCLL